MRVTWLRAYRSRDVGLPVVGGRVECPYKGVTDVDRCVDCPLLARCDDEGGVLRMYCRPLPRLWPPRLPYIS